jgi:hypothetical protein
MVERLSASFGSADGIPLAEEEVRIDKREVPTGRVRVRTATEVVEELARATLDEDVVEVTRVAGGA